MTVHEILIGYDSASATRKAFLKSTGHKAKKLWGNNTRARRQWFAQTVELIDRGVHALQTGGFRTGQHDRL